MRLTFFVTLFLAVCGILIYFMRLRDIFVVFVRYCGIDTLPMSPS